jgi:MFS family permease
MLLLTVPGGLLSDRFGRKAVLMLSLLANVSTFLVLYYANGFLMLMVPMMLGGIAFGLFGPTMQSLVADLATPDNRRIFVAWYTVSASAGMFVGPLMCSILLQFITMRDIFLVTLGITLVELVVGILVVKNPSHSRAETGLIGKHLSNIIFNRNILCSSIAILSYFFVDSCVMTFFPIMALDVYGLSPPFVSSIFVLRNLVLLVSRTFVVTRLVGKFSEKKMLIASLSLPLSLALSFIFPGYMTLSVLIVLTGVSLGIVFTMGAMIVAESASSSERGLANSIYFSAMNVGSMISPTIMGMLANILGVTMIFPIAALVPIIGLLAGFMIKTK